MPYVEGEVFGVVDRVYSVSPFVEASALICFCLVRGYGRGGCRGIITGEWKRADTGSVRSLIPESVRDSGGAKAGIRHGACREIRSALSMLWLDMVSCCDQKWESS